MTQQRFLLLTGMILVAAASKFIPHPPNFAPIGAIALFGGAHFQSRRTAFLVPIAALFLGDLITGLHHLLPFVYGAFALYVCLGLWVRRQRSPFRIVLASLLGSTLFFLITNFGVWALLGTFPPTGAGLLQCYLAGVPYFGNTVLGDFFYTALLFGGLSLAEFRFPVLREQKVSAL